MDTLTAVTDVRIVLYGGWDETYLSDMHRLGFSYVVMPGSTLARTSMGGIQTLTPS